MARLAAILALALVATISVALAQTPPLGGLEPSRPGDERRPLPELGRPPPELEFILPPVLPPPEKAPLRLGPRFVLHSVTFDGNTIFTDEELNKVAAPFLEQPVAAEQLEDLRRRLTLHYIDAGYINSGAVLPDQTVVEGNITYRIVEGELSDIVIVGNERLSVNYVRDRIMLDAGPPLDVNRLQERLRILLDDPLIERVDAELGPGLRPGESELTVRVQETSPFQINLSIGNGRSPSVGAEEARGQLVMRNWSGLGEIVALSIGKTEGLRDIEGQIGIPIAPWDTRLILRVEDTISEIVEKPFNQIDVESESRDYEVTLRQPVYQAPGRELAASLSFVRRESETFLLGQPFSFAEGVKDGKSVVSVFRGAFDWVDRSPEQVLALRSIFSYGADIFGATINPADVPDGEFFHWIGQAQWVRRFDFGGVKNVRVVARGEAQLTDDRLLPLEKFAIGGADTVRGYRENFLVRDNGWDASLEVRIPVFDLSIPGMPTELDDGRVDIAPFFDIGQSWDNDVFNPSPRTISSIGLGLRWAPIQGVLASLYYGYALRAVDDPDDTDLQDDGIYFSIRASFF
jgi:hemolysin activation/secretion protein